MFRILLIISLTATLHHAADAKRITATQWKGRVNAIYNRAVKKGIVNLPGLMPMTSKGERYSVGRRGLIRRSKNFTKRIQVRGNRITTKTRYGSAKSKQSSSSRSSTHLRGDGLATCTTVEQEGKHSKTEHDVLWKNSSATIDAPLSPTQLNRLRRELANPITKIVARAKAMISTNRTRDLIPVIELKQALKRMGLQHSTDWRPF